jgi:hypothetical protein
MSTGVHAKATQEHDKRETNQQIEKDSICWRDEFEEFPR